MSVSSHLNPEPERRLWTIHDNMRLAAVIADSKLGAMAFFALLEIALLRLDAAFGLLATAIVFLMAVVLLICLFAVSPFVETAARAPLRDHRLEHEGADSLITARDLASRPHIELVNRLDRYLGGGVTATPYYEDIVGRIAVTARAVVRKQRLFSVSCVLALASQLLLAFLLSSRQA